MVPLSVIIFDIFFQIFFLNPFDNFGLQEINAADDQQRQNYTMHVEINYE